MVFINENYQRPGKGHLEGLGLMVYETYEELKRILVLQYMISTTETIMYGASDRKPVMVSSQ